MLKFNKAEDIEKMKNYYRTSDMINLPEYFLEISPVRDLTIIENEEGCLVNGRFTHFSIHGHTEGKDFCPWQMFDKSRYELVKTRKFKN